MAVNLQKGQKISLNKEAGSALTQVVMGLGWDAAKKKGFLGNLVGSVTSGEGMVLKFSGQGQVLVCSRNKDNFLAWLASKISSKSS